MGSIRKCGLSVTSSQFSRGRRMSALIIHARVPPKVLGITLASWRISPAPQSCATAFWRQSTCPFFSAPEACQRCCQLSPGCNSSHDKILSNPRRSWSWRSMPLDVVYSDSIRTISARPSRVAGQSPATGREGYRAHSASASAVICRGWA